MSRFVLVHGARQATIAGVVFEALMRGSHTVVVIER